MDDHSSNRQAAPLNVLVLAYTCHPLRGSEEGVGWSWVRALAEHCRLTVVTADHFGSRAAIDQVFAKEPMLAERLRFVFLDDFLPERRDTLLERFWGYFPPLYYWFYQRWMKRAWAVAEDLSRRERFDLAHQLTMIGYREPGYLWRLPLPCVWGPVGGTQNTPWRFLCSLGLVEGLRHAFRNTLNRWQFRTSRRLRQALGRVASVFTIAPDTRDLLLSVYGVRSEIIHEVFTVPGHPLGRVRKPASDQPLRLVFSGLHISSKGLSLVLRAVARLPRGVCWHLDVLGAGIMTNKWRREALALGVGDRITWHGLVPRQTALEVMSTADLMVFPSLKEATSTVVAEALSLGMPVITLNHHGMADYVDDSCGVRIAVTTPALVVREMEAVLAHLSGSPAEIERLSLGALARARFFSAEVQAPRVMDIYRRVVSR